MVKFLKLLGWLLVVFVLGWTLESVYIHLQVWPAVLIIEELEFDLGGFMFLLLVAFGINKIRPAQLGLDWRSLKRKFLPGLLAGLLLCGGYFLFTALTGSGESYFIYPDFFLTLLFAPMILIAAFYEELLFRGYVLNRLSGSLILLVAITAAFDMVMHFDFEYGAIVFHLVSAVAFAYLYLWTGSLWFSAGYHSGWNLGLEIVGFWDTVSYNAAMLIAALAHLAALMLLRFILQRKGLQCKFTGRLNVPPAAEEVSAEAI